MGFNLLRIGLLLCRLRSLLLCHILRCRLGVELLRRRRLHLGLLLEDPRRARRRLDLLGHLQAPQQRPIEAAGAALSDEEAPEVGPDLVDVLLPIAGLVKRDGEVLQGSGEASACDLEMLQLLQFVIQLVPQGGLHEDLPSVHTQLVLCGRKPAARPNLRILLAFGLACRLPECWDLLLLRLNRRLLLVRASHILPLCLLRLLVLERHFLRRGPHRLRTRKPPRNLWGRCRLDFGILGESLLCSCWRFLLHIRRWCLIFVGSFVCRGLQATLQVMRHKLVGIRWLLLDQHLEHRLHIGENTMVL
mmetsp:Transcript_63286/g.205436  ORF Transcript_63286/g.205436 Transcript_63286/m.205436 type:complete len:304 (-) Transcript_63286:451-1362(-)